LQVHELRALAGLKHVIRRVTDTIELRAQLMHLQSEMNAFYAEIRDHVGDGDDPPALPATVIMIDDYDATSEAVGPNSEVLLQLRDHVRLHSELGLYIWIAGYLERTTDPLIKQLLLKRSGFAMIQRDSLQKLNVRTTGLSADAMPEGRLFYPMANSIRVIQSSLVEQPGAYVNQINERLWGDHERADWLHPADIDTAMRAMQVPQQRGRAYGDGNLSIDTAGLIEDLIGKQISGNR
jgi:hypothetical protein